MAGLDDAIASALSATAPTVVPLGRKKVRIVPPMQWRQSAMRALRTGDFDTWAQECFVNDYVPAKGAKKATGSDDVTTWVDANLTNAEVIDFMAAYAVAAGQAPGE